MGSFLAQSAIFAARVTFLNPGDGVMGSFLWLNRKKCGPESHDVFRETLFCGKNSGSIEKIFIVSQMTCFRESFFSERY
jgi:hypothetical protein